MACTFSSVLDVSLLGFDATTRGRRTNSGKDGTRVARVYELPRWQRAPDVCFLVLPVCDHRRHCMLCCEADIPYSAPLRRSDMMAREMPEDTDRSCPRT